MTAFPRPAARGSRSHRRASRRRRRSPACPDTCPPTDRRRQALGRLCVARAEGGPRLDGQLIGRKVVDGHGQRLRQFAAPMGAVPILPGIDQIKLTRVKQSRAISKAARASATECIRPRRRRSSSLSACTPSRRGSPRLGKGAEAPVSTLVGLASSVISISLAKGHASRAARSRRRRCRASSGWACRRQKNAVQHPAR